MDNQEKYKIAIIGLGYVGLPLAVEFSKKYQVLGFDIDSSRINQLISGFDRTGEIESKDIFINNRLKLSYKKEDLNQSNIYIITVPTPIDKYKVPDLMPLIRASEMVGVYLKKGDIVICVTNKMYGMTFLLEVGEQYQIDAFTEVGEKNLVSVTNIKNNQDIGIFDDKHFMPLDIWREFQLRKILE